MDVKVTHSLSLIRKALRDHERVAVACSFGKDSIVTLHLARRVNSEIPVFAVMTPFKPKETIQFMEQVRKIWKLNLTVYQANVELTSELKELHKKDPDKCCSIFKVAPCRRAVKNLDAWISGLRKDEGRTRTNYQEVEFRGLAKINPILSWTEADLWRYTATHNLPVHPFYKLGYRSLGCACCSEPNTTEERGGRWKGTSKCGGECGIHTRDLK
ncbi:Phosphoadenosine phosphosulfate reductase [subsurface metagenome]